MSDNNKAELLRYLRLRLPSANSGRYVWPEESAEAKEIREALHLPETEIMQKALELLQEAIVTR